MNGKTYKVIKEVVKCKNGYIPTNKIAFDTNLTSRQVHIILSDLRLPFVEKEYDVKLKTNRLLLNATEEERRALIVSATRDYYDLSDSMIDTVRNSLSTIGWMNVSDIACDTGLDDMDVAMILSIMDNVDSTELSSRMFYRRVL